MIDETWLAVESSMCILFYLKLMNFIFTLGSKHSTVRFKQYRIIQLATESR